jgi:hypothetical protein
LATEPTHSEQFRSPSAKLAAMVQRLEALERHQTVNGSMVKDLRDAAERIEAVHRTAAEMQVGAEGFDNTHTASLYSTVQQHLLAALRELVQASAALKDEEEVWASVER